MIKYLSVLFVLLGLIGCATQSSSTAKDSALVSVRCSVDEYGPVTLPSGITATASKLRVISPASLVGRRIFVDLIADGGAPASYSELRHLGELLTIKLPQSAIERAQNELLPWNLVTIEPKQ